MNPIFRFIDWMLREHGAFISGLFIYLAVPLTAWYLGRRSGEKNQDEPHICSGDSISCANIVGSAVRYPLEFRVAG
jgi:hypothetical protein